MYVNPYLDEDKLLQYCLDQGTGIEYKANDTNRTTDAEIQAAVAENRPVRYVSNHTLNVLYNWHRPEQIAYAVNTNMDLCDFDDWQALQNAFGIAMHYSTEKEIENILITREELRPLEISTDADFKRVIEDKYLKGNSLSVDDAIAYMLSQRVQHKTATQISSVIMRKLSINVTDLIIHRIITELSERQKLNAINPKRALEAFHRVYPEFADAKIVGGTDDGSGLIIDVGDGYHIVNEKVVSPFIKDLDKAKREHI